MSKQFSHLISLFKYIYMYYHNILGVSDNVGANVSISNGTASSVNDNDDADGEYNREAAI